MIPEFLATDPTVQCLSPDDVLEGDIIFTARKGRLQTLVELCGDPWRHCGIAAVMTDAHGAEHMSICEVRGDSFQFRTLESMLPHQIAVGVVRLGADRAACPRPAVQWTKQIIETGHVYAWDDLVLTGMMLVTRRRAPATHFDEVVRVVSAAQEAALPRRGQSFTCSNFVYEAFARAGKGCKLDIALEELRTEPERFRDALPAPPAVGLDELIGAPPEEREKVLADYTILELSGLRPGPLTEPRYRSSNDSHISPGQFARVVRTLVKTLSGLSEDKPLPSRLEIGGRWVTPGDFWRMDGISLRGYLPIPPVPAP